MKKPETTPNVLSPSRIREEQAFNEQAAKEIPALADYHEFRLHEDRPGEFTLSRNGWGLGYTFKNRKRAEQAQTALNNAIALDYCDA